MCSFYVYLLILLLENVNMPYTVLLARYQHTATNSKLSSFLVCNL